MRECLSKMFNKFIFNPWSTVIVNGAVTLFELVMYYYTCSKWSLVSAGFCGGMLVSSLIDLPRRRRDALFSVDQIRNLDRMIATLRDMNNELRSRHDP